MKMALNISAKWRVLTSILVLLILVWLTIGLPITLTAQERASAGWLIDGKKSFPAAIPDNSLEQAEGEGKLDVEDFEFTYKGIGRVNCNFSYTGYSTVAYTDYHPEIHIPPPNFS